MPIIKSAKKKLRQDKKRSAQNAGVRSTLKKAIRTARITPSPQNLQRAYSALDTAAKKRIIHPHKSARLKSRLAQVKVTDQNSKAKSSS